MEILILCGIYLVELLCFQVGIKMLFEMRLKKEVYIIVGIIMFVLIGIMLPIIMKILPVNIAGRNVLVTISVIIVILISGEGDLIEKIVKLVLSFLLLESVDGIFTNPCKMALINVGIHYNGLIYLITNCCTLICIFTLNLIKKKIKRFGNTHIKSIIYLIIGIIASSMMLCLGIFNTLINYWPSNVYTVLYNIIYVATTSSMFLLIVSVIYIKNTHERMEQLLKTEQLLKEYQVNYYREVLKKEVDTRKYRHDMMNHLIFIQGILNKKKIDDAQRYLTSILGGFQKIQNTYYVIGNEMIDTIMNYFFGMLPKDTKIEIRGRCPVEIDMEDTEICVVFSNVFQNAVEEIVENKLRNASIIVDVKKGRQFVEYNVKNTILKEIDERRINKNGLPKSYKLDKNNHGIGMINVRNTIDRSNGKFEWTQERGFFCVSIILPIK